MDEKHKLTADEARTFERVSEMHTTILEQAAEERGCTCRPYRDWFTYNRWQAQGMQVQKGEHGVKLVTYPSAEVERGGRTVRRSFPRTTAVFCRCQVAPVEVPAMAAAAA